MAIDSFNKYRSNENNLAKQRYKYCEYKNQHGRGGSRAGGCAGVLPS